jgi:integrase
MNRPRKKDRHLPRCVYLKHNAYWLVRKGKWHRLGDDLHAALTAYAAIYETPKGGTAELIEEAFLAIKPNLKASTVKQYAQAAGKLKKMLAEFSPEQVQPVHAARIKKAMAKTPNMANRVLSFARQVFDYALEEERVTINPFVGIRRHQEAKRTRLVTAEEFAAIYAKAGPRLQVVLELLRLTGQRITAVLRIRRSDLVEDGIRFPHHKTDTKRIVKWTPELREGCRAGQDPERQHPCAHPATQSPRQGAGLQHGQDPVEQGEGSRPSGRRDPARSARACRD